jgi:hypothetical protein
MIPKTNFPNSHSVAEENQKCVFGEHLPIRWILSQLVPAKAERLNS